MTNTNAIVITATNAIQTVVENLLPGSDVLSTAARSVSELSNQGLFVVAMIVFGWMLKKMPTVYNELIPAISSVVAMIVYPLLMGFSARNFVIGFVLGAVATGLHQIPRQLGYLQERRRTGDTQTIKKSDTPV